MVFHVCLMALKENVLAENTPYPKFSYITFTENHNCYDIFNDIQCEYMQNIMHVLLEKFENEKFVFKYPMKQIKQEVKLMKKQLKQTVNNHYTTPNTKQKDENFTKKYTHGQSMKLHKVLANIDPLFGGLRCCSLVWFLTKLVEPPPPCIQTLVQNKITKLGEYIKWS